MCEALDTLLCSSPVGITERMVWLPKVENEKIPTSLNVFTPQRCCELFLQKYTFSVKLKLTPSGLNDQTLLSCHNNLLLMSCNDLEVLIWDEMEITFLTPGVSEMSTASITSSIYSLKMTKCCKKNIIAAVLSNGHERSITDWKERSEQCSCDLPNPESLWWKGWNGTDAFSMQPNYPVLWLLCLFPFKRGKKRAK